jgi:hypothetical protein
VTPAPTAGTAGRSCAMELATTRAGRFAGRLLGLNLGATIALLLVAPAQAGATPVGVAHSPRHAPTSNGLVGGRETLEGRALTSAQSMLWKYTARCVLREGQELEGADAATGEILKFPGSFGIAPGWREGTCDAHCQESVSACLIALTNRTGKHVLVSLLSAAVPSLGSSMAPNENDLAFPHQEGAFFGNVFSGEAYACRGRAAEKGQQVKRFCALEPATCSGLATFADAGRCDDACEMSCTGLSDGTERCAARSCKDPKGRVWTAPITTYLRNRVEAANADAVEGVTVGDDGLRHIGDGAAATYRSMDFGTGARAQTTFAARLIATRTLGRIEVWLAGERRLGTLPIRATGGIEKEEAIRLDTEGVSGEHDVVLKLVGAKALVLLSTIELRAAWPQ